MLREAYGVVDPCKYCMELKSMYPDHFIDCSGNAKMDEFKYWYLRETPMSMSNGHTHSTAIMNCNDRQAYRSLLDKIFSVRYIDRALIIKAFVDNELVKFHPHLAAITWWYNALLYRFVWPDCFKKMDKSSMVLTWPSEKSKTTSVEW